MEAQPWQRALRPWVKDLEIGVQRLGLRLLATGVDFEDYRFNHDGSGFSAERLRAKEAIFDLSPSARSDRAVVAEHFAVFLSVSVNMHSPLRITCGAQSLWW